MTKTKLVVVNENTLAYIQPDMPKYAYILHASILRGATYGRLETNILLGNCDKVRLASKKDFDDYRVSFGGFEKDPQYEYHL